MFQFLKKLIKGLFLFILISMVILLVIGLQLAPDTGCEVDWNLRITTGKSIASCTDHYPDGELKSEGKLISGMYEGEWLYYHPNGQIRKKTYFKGGEREGLWEYFDTEGTLTRTEEYFYENDRLKVRTQFKNKQLEDRPKTTFEQYVYDPKDGFDLSFNLHTDELREIVQYKNGYLHGVSELFDQDGKTISLSKYSAGKLIVEQRISYYESGKLQAKQEFTIQIINAFETIVANGLYEAFYENGQLMEIGNYKDGEKEGIWKRFDDEGNAVETENF